jgi:hypothetical protein
MLFCCCFFFRKGGSDGDGLFASAEDFAELLEETAETSSSTAGTSHHVSNTDRASKSRDLMGIGRIDCVVLRQSNSKDCVNRGKNHVTKAMLFCGVRIG